MLPRYISPSFPSGGSTGSSNSSYFTLLLSFFAGTIFTLLFVSLGYTPLIPKETYTNTLLTSNSHGQVPLTNQPKNDISGRFSSSSTVSNGVSSSSSVSTNHRLTSSSSAGTVEHNSIRGKDSGIPDEQGTDGVVLGARSGTIATSSTASTHYGKKKAKPVTKHKISPQDDDDDDDDDDNEDRRKIEQPDLFCPPVTKECNCPVQDSATVTTSTSTTSSSTVSASASTFSAITTSWQTTDPLLTKVFQQSSYSYPIGYNPPSSSSPLPPAVSMEVHIPGWIYTNVYTIGPLYHTGSIDNFIQYRKSQGEEDTFALTQFFWNKEGGIILESGAWDGIGFSTSYLFYHTLGWKSVHIEPAPANYKMLIKNRPDALNIHTALCEQYQTVHWIEHTGLNDQEKAHLGAIDGIAEFMAPKFRDQFWPGLSLDDLSAYPTIPCRPLVPLLLQYGLNHIDFWVLDVEGAELQVLKAVNFNEISFDVIVIEADGFAPEKDANVITYLTGKGYRHMGHHARNDWFVRDGFVPSKRNP